MSVFAIHRLELGDRTSDGWRSDSAWRDHGFNLDAKVTDRSALDVCKRLPNSHESVQVDGNDGIDNSFGANVLPLMRAVFHVSEPSKDTSDAFGAGRATLQLVVRGWANDPDQTALGLTSGALRSWSFAGDAAPAPEFPGFLRTTDWAVPKDALLDGGSPRFASDDGWVKSGTAVFKMESIVVPVVAPTAYDLVVHHATIRLVRTKDPNVVRGTIAGVLDPDEVEQTLRQVDMTRPDGCKYVLPLTLQMRQAADIMADLSNAPGKSCDAISIGLGFEATRIAAPTKVAAPRPVPPACK